MSQDWNDRDRLPKFGTVILAVPVYGSPHHPDRAGEFLQWDVWTQDLDCDWDEMQEIGWSVNDATMWLACPPPPNNR